MFWSYPIANNALNNVPNNVESGGREKTFIILKPYPLKLSILKDLHKPKQTQTNVIKDISFGVIRVKIGSFQTKK